MTAVEKFGAAFMALLGIALFVVVVSASQERRAPEPDHEITCHDKITGERLFSFWEGSVRDQVIVIGGDSYATVTLDNGRAVKITNSDLNSRYACTPSMKAPSYE